MSNKIGFDTGKIQKKDHSIHSNNQNRWKLAWIN